MRQKSSEQQGILIPLTDRNKQKMKENLPQKTGLSGQKHVAPQILPNARNSLNLRVRLQLGEKELSGHTEGISPEGLRLISDTDLSVGTPLALQCSFGEICYLHLSGQVVSCQSAGNTKSEAYVIEIKFSALREWEHKILCSGIQELIENASAQEKSFLTLRVSKDTLALEAASLSTSAPEMAVHDLGTASSSHASMASPVLAEKPRRFSSKRSKKFTPNPAWVIEMDTYLEPYRQVIWQSKLVQETSTGQLSLRQVKGWSIQFYPFIEYFPQFMATYLAKATDPMSRVFLIENLRIEKRHADQWIDMAKAFGVPREELFNTPIIPGVEALTHWMWSITSRGSFVEAVSATNYAIEGVTQGIATIMVKGFAKYHGKNGVLLDDKAYSWMEAHSSYDDLHPLEALEIIKLHALSSELQQKVKHAAKRSLEYLYGALEACYSVYSTEHASDTSSKVTVS